MDNLQQRFGRGFGDRFRRRHAVIVMTESGPLPECAVAVVRRFVAKGRRRRGGGRPVLVAADETLIQHQRTRAEPDRQRRDEHTGAPAHDPMILQPRLTQVRARNRTAGRRCARHFSPNVASLLRIDMAGAEMGRIVSPLQMRSSSDRRPVDPGAIAGADRALHTHAPQIAQRLVCGIRNALAVCINGGQMTTGKRGFASMDRNRQREIASKGGKLAHLRGMAHEWTSEEAREAGRKGGAAVRQRKPAPEPQRQDQE